MKLSVYGWTTVGMVFVVVFAEPITGAIVHGADEAAVWKIHNMHQHPWFNEVLAASVVGWVLGLVKGFSTSGDWLKRYFPNPPVSVVFLLDVIIFIVFGAYFGTGIYNPASFLEAIAAGLSWPVGLGALATQDEPNKQGKAGSPGLIHEH